MIIFRNRYDVQFLVFSYVTCILLLKCNEILADIETYIVLATNNR